MFVLDGARLDTDGTVDIDILDIEDDNIGSNILGSA
jgi:hypothetical protein